jgi:sugar lactone lactonase YvrE
VGTISPFTGNIATIQQAACSQPEGLTIDFHGNFYIASAAITTATGHICEFDPHGTLTRVISIPAGPSQVISLLGVQFQAPHTIFALDFAGTLSPKLPANGRVLSVNTETGAVTTIASGFTFPNGIAEDLLGNLYVTDSFQGTITRMRQDGSNKTVWSSDPLLSGNGSSNPGLPIGANGIQFDLFFQHVYVANTINRRILRIPVGPGFTAGTPEIFADGATLDQSQPTPGSLKGADGLTLDLFGNVYVAANAANEIQVLTPGGQLVARYGNTNLPVDTCASPLFVGNQLYFTNVSLLKGGLNSSVAVLQTALPGLPPL